MSYDLRVSTGCENCQCVFSRRRRCYDFFGFFGFGGSTSPAVAAKTS